MRDIQNVLGTVSSLYNFLEGGAKQHAKSAEMQHASATGRLVCHQGIVQCMQFF